ncbi:MAG: ATP-dependent DNA helicase RecG [Firmicutes bacterium]|nr:ATP-dependent DNA helicase RecG [Bacillota bacterium]
MNFQSSITEIKGIGQKKAELLKKLNIETVADLINLYPRSYQDRRYITPISQLVPGNTYLVRAHIINIVNNKFSYGKKKTLKITADDGSGRMEAVFFNAGFMANAFTAGEEYLFYGRVNKGYANRLQMTHPEFSQAAKETLRGIIPVYPLTEGISQNEMRKWQRELNTYAENAEEFLPADIINRNNLCSYSYALSNIHFPKDEQKFKEARYRLVFDEMLQLQTGLLAIKKASSGKNNGIAFDKKIKTDDYIKSLPYPLTRAQQKAAGEIISDMESKNVMSRLVQGDVGSGKTAVAEIAMYKAVKCGFQTVLMAPTEILARQHFEGIKERFSAFGIRTGFLSGSVTKTQRETILEMIKTGSLDVIIGTHAIIQPDVKFKNLGLVITDEQHRFGVNHRMLLGQKGKNPDQIVMTATPIPRTLAVILYGDLDISVIDELPPGRQSITTKTVDETRRIDAYRFVKGQIEKGRQAYVVAPLIEDSDTINVRSAESVYDELHRFFSENTVALLHGEMKQKEKDDIMERFKNGKIDILVSTVVIEVGINVPNATVMVIENSERFGLAQLHQLRGRVGRGEHKSYCILINSSKSEIAAQRAEIMINTSDGFIIAEKDLELRGPGEFFGTRQHGVPDLKIANLVKHIDMLETVKKESLVILAEDPLLESEKYAGLKTKIIKTFNGNLNLKM